MSDLKEYERKFHVLYPIIAIYFYFRIFFLILTEIHTRMEMLHVKNKISQ